MYLGTSRQKTSLLARKSLPTGTGLFLRRVLKNFGNAALFLFSVATLFSAVNLATKQTPVFFPEGSFYNFFAGANEYASKHLGLSYNAENSVDEALRARGIVLNEYSDFLSFPSKTYGKFALEYIKGHPFE